ncbi:EFR1 family ferrodoxin [Clostridium scatologenes]|uniref:Iron-sulfur cluster-binding protein n=1 Tax=Clostridium scatologenes TaxID=1548 RepID=A0A0E3K271_CLOSL|nr:EFR1 family ferrodoxin [Clostridium scatologenes]AKA70552.1 iron-sulfur cluster-binding protein [Clostridium scatologenes]
MKSVIIYYFSGTGNTELVKNMIEKGLSNNEYDVTVVKIEDVLKKKLKIEVEKYDLVGIGSQVIGFGVPNIVNDFVKVLPKTKGKKVFIFRTAGGVVPKNYNCSKPMIRKLSRKGYKVFYERIFSIASNWIIKFDDQIVKKLYEATSKKAEIMCREIISGKERRLKIGIGLKAVMEFAIFASSRLIPLTGKDLTISKECVHCGLCIKNCPVENIYEKKGKIKFGLSCNGCMRCVYSCPKVAIKYRHLKFFSVPGGYNIKKVLSKTYDQSKMPDKVPPFFNRYIEDDTM